MNLYIHSKLVFNFKIYRKYLSMKMKFLKLKSMSTALILSCSSGVSADIVIDFSDVQCFGAAPDLVQVNNIRVDTVITNPFSGDVNILSNYYDVPFVFDLATLSLVSDLTRAVIDNDNRNCANLKVIVQNAVTGETLSDVLVSINDIVMITNSTGEADFTDLPSGGLVEITATSVDYTELSRSVELICGDNDTIALNMNPKLVENGGISADEIRIVASWGEYPRDLDAHLTGPAVGLAESSINEADRFHIFWSHRSHEEIALLDTDDVSSFGPETITILPPSGSTQLVSGTYRYSIYQYSSSGLIDNTAQITLYIGNNPARTFIPELSQYQGMEERSGNVWTVFELVVNEVGTVTVNVINNISFQTGYSSGVRDSSNVSSEPFNIFYGE